MLDEKIKQEAIRLRTEEKLSLKEIAEKLDIAKSTASLWLRDYRLPEEELTKRNVSNTSDCYKQQKCKQERNKYCLMCTSKVLNGRKYCSTKCQCEYEQKKYINEWLAENIDGNFKGRFKSTSKRIRNYLIEQCNNTCAICKLNTWMGKPIPLTLDHIDGNSYNNRPENLRMICPNCDRQTETYGSKNRGNGRHIRRQRYKEGKSY